MKFYIISLTVVPLLLLGCKKKEGHWTLEISKLRQTYIYTLQNVLDDTKEAYNPFYADVSLFQSTSLQFALDSSKASWGRAYNQFLLLGPYRSALNSGIGFETQKNYLDLFPLNYGYLDYTAADPNSGIINNTGAYPEISQNYLLVWNQAGGEQNLSCGFHVIEFLLWGEDLIPGAPGQRTHTDFTINATEIKTRRRHFLWYATANLKSSINQLVYTEDFKNSILKMNMTEFMKGMLDGITGFIDNDLVVKTIKTPLDVPDSRFEISDFSDQSLVNIKTKVQALKYAFNSEGLADAQDGSRYFLENFIDQLAPESMDKIQGSFSHIDAALNGINVSFETAILSSNHRAALQQVIDHLHVISAELKEFRKNFE